MSSPKIIDILAAAVAVPATACLTYLQAKGLLPKGSLILGVVLIVVLDTVTGIWAARAKRQKLSSQRLARVVKKLALYLILVEAITILAMLLPASDLRDWVQAVPVSAICAVELLSIVENIEAIRPNTLPSWVAKKLRDYGDDGALNNSNNNE